MILNPARNHTNQLFQCSFHYPLELDIINEGYASVSNARKVELILRNKKTLEVYKQELDTDPKYWFTGEQFTITTDSKWKRELPKGEHELFLNLSDVEPSLNDRPEYAIHLAGKLKGKSVWNAETGWNLVFQKYSCLLKAVLTNGIVEVCYLLYLWVFNEVLFSGKGNKVELLYNKNIFFLNFKHVYKIKNHT